MLAQGILVIGYLCCCPDLLKELGKLGNANTPTKSVINAINICFKPFDGCDFCHQGLGVINIVFIVMEDYSGLSQERALPNLLMRQRI